MRIDSIELKKIFENISFYDILLCYGDSAQEEIMKKIEKVHPYAITPPKTKSGRWQTSYKGSDGKRKNIKATTKDELLVKLVRLYKDDSYIEKLTFESLFHEWIEYKSATVSSNTIVRHRQRYRRYFSESGLNSMLVKNIDLMTLENICNGIVKKYNMTGKEWRNTKTIPLEMFEYAKRKNYISCNLVTDMKISVKFRQVNKKTGRTETFNTEELDALKKYLQRKYAETKDASFLAVQLNFYLGLRVGELVALKWEDMEDSGLHITREEIYDTGTNAFHVVEHTKTHSDRYVILTDKALSLLDMLPHGDGGYLFKRNGQRLHTRQIAYVLEKYAERMNVTTKSTHKIRKTYASLLNASGVPLDCIRELLGHARISTTLGYLYNPLTEQETVDLVTKALG